jgi:hypothetical protein
MITLVAIMEVLFWIFLAASAVVWIVVGRMLYNERRDRRR